MIFSAWKCFETVTKPDSSMHLRELEPLVGRFLRMAKPEDNAIYNHWMNQEYTNEDSESFRRGGYLLELLSYYGPYSEQWGNILFSPSSGWLLLSSMNVDKKSALIPFYQNDQRINDADEMVLRWHLSSGALYDRLKKLTRPPYVC